MEGNVNRSLDLATEDDDIEQEAKALYARLENLRARAREDGANKRRVQNYRTRLVEDLSQIGFVEMTSHVESFMRDVGEPTTGPNTAVNTPLWKLIELKYRELEQAHWAEAPEEELNAGIDLIWSVMSLLLAQGHDVRGAFLEVSRANHDKVPPGIVPIIGKDGRIAKPEGWKPPQLAEFVGF
jgi:hypothetical protein